jgi:hypothetical protein
MEISTQGARGSNCLKRIGGVKRVGFWKKRREHVGLLVRTVEALAWNDYWDSGERDGRMEIYTQR